MPGLDEPALHAAVDEISGRWPAVGLAAGVVRGGELEYFHGHGLADIATGTPITPDTVFRIASITKTFTAIAILQLHERGILDLDTPASHYLTSYQLTPASPAHRPPTLRHLLTHTAGIREVLHPSGLLSIRDLGETVPDGRRAPSLAEYYRGRLRADAEPGTRFTYTNHGFATLGQIIQDVTGEPLDRYYRAHIFDPLGMAHTDLARSDRVRSRLATGYELRGHGAEAVSRYEVVTAGAGGVYSTTRDMARYLAALLGGGAGEYGRILEPATLASMFAPHYQPDPRVPGFGLAFFRADLAGHQVVEHDGILPGFDSQLAAAPDDGIGVLAFANGAKRGLHWLTPEINAVLRRLLGVQDEEIRTDIPQRPELWADLAGWYKFPAYPTDPSRLGIGAGAEVLIRRGQLILRFLSPLPQLYRGFPLHPDDENDPYVFRVEIPLFGSQSTRIVFGTEPEPGKATAIHLAAAPLSFGRRPAASNPRYWVTGALAAGVAAAALRRHRGSHQAGRHD